MIAISERKIKKCSITDIDPDFLFKFYECESNKQSVLLVYDDNEMIALYSYENFQSIKQRLNPKTLETSVKVFNCFFAESMYDAEKKFETNKYISLIIKELNEGTGTFYWRCTNSDYAYYALKRSGVSVYGINIPYINSITNDKIYIKGDHIHFWHYLRYIIDNDLELPDNLDKITEHKDLKDVRLGKLHGRTFGDSKKMIYLAGPCIVGGWTVLEGETLPEILAQKLKESGMDYSIKCIELLDKDENSLPILKCDISPDDIVIIISHGLYFYDFDTTDAYNSYTGNKYLFMGIPVHTTVTGNKMLADYILDNILLPRGNTDLPSAFRGEPQFSWNTRKEIYSYINRISGIRKINKDSVTGAIIMNCNPFTNGHRYLIECALKQVDYLYVFVVEEDLSAVPYLDRLLMIYENVKNIPNVIIAPSGKFIISSSTFKNYFIKETNISAADAEEDVYIFAKYIAKELGITKRFAGEEPLDKVTNSYNETMKRILPQYGIEFIEIPRMTMADSTVINATAVRNYLLKDEWDEIKKYVPEATYYYLKNIKEIVKERINKKEAALNTKVITYNEYLLDMISGMDKVVIYSIGNNTRKIINQLPENIVERLEFCDKSAETVPDALFCSKRVHTPKQLTTELRDHYIIVTATLKSNDIYKDLTELGIDMNRVFFNI